MKLSLLPKPPFFSPQNNKLNVTRLTFVSVHLTAVGDERHLLRPAHVLVPDCIIISCKSTSFLYQHSRFKGAPTLENAQGI